MRDADGGASTLRRARIMQESRMFQHILIPSTRKDPANPGGPRLLTSRMVYEGQNPDGQEFSRSLAGDITLLDRTCDMIDDVLGSAGAAYAAFFKEQANTLDTCRLDLTKMFADKCAAENRSIPVPLSRRMAKAKQVARPIGSIERADLKVA